MVDEPDVVIGGWEGGGGERITYIVVIFFILSPEIIEIIQNT